MSSELQVPRPDLGVLFVISGPSGVGKSTLLKHTLATVPHLGFSVSATTRAPRKGEQDGVDYHFLDGDTFRARLANGDFLEHAEVYDRFYGTLAAPTRKALNTGISLVLDIDVQGAAQVRITHPGAVHIMIVPPDIESLERRLRARGTDSDDVIGRRMSQVHQQLGALGSYDYVVVNGDLETALATLRGVVLAEMSRRDRMSSWVARFSS